MTVEQLLHQHAKELMRADSNKKNELLLDKVRRVGRKPSLLPILPFGKIEINPTPSIPSFGSILKPKL